MQDAVSCSIVSRTEVTNLQSAIDVTSEVPGRGKDVIKQELGRRAVVETLDYHKAVQPNINPSVSKERSKFAKSSKQGIALTNIDGGTRCREEAVRDFLA
ncbi:hypothetical protein HDU77_011316 [Chytriomyces hyalinus]|nr:hypothetical protein HDU77_011316 [Chytriomyces hyalinus]